MVNILSLAKKIILILLIFCSLSKADEIIDSETKHLEALIEQRRYEEAFNFINITEPNNDKYGFYKNSADFLMRMGKYIKAIDYFKLAYLNATNQKEKDYTILRRGECYFNLRYFDEAYVVLKNLIKLSPNTLYLNDAYLLLAQSAESINRIDEALLYYQKLSPTLTAQIIKAKAFVRLGKYNDAVKIFDTMIKTEKAILSEKADLYYYYGEALRNLGRYKQAKTYLSGAKRLAAFKDKATVSLGLIAYQEKDYDAALGYFNEVAIENKRDALATALYYIGKIYFEKGLKKEAKKSFLSLRNSCPVAKEYKDATIYLIKIVKEEKDYESFYRYTNELLKSFRTDNSLVDEIESLLLELSQSKSDEFKKAFERYGIYLYKARRFDILIKLTDALSEDKREKLLNNIFLMSMGEERKKVARILFEYYIKKQDFDKALKFETYVEKNVTKRLKIYDYLISSEYDKVLDILINSKDLTKEDLEILFYISDKVKDRKKVNTIITKSIGINGLTLVEYIRLGDYFFTKDRKLAMKCYQKALSFKGIKPDEKEKLDMRLVSLEKKEKQPLDLENQEFKDLLIKINEKEEKIEKILKGYKL